MLLPFAVLSIIIHHTGKVVIKLIKQLHNINLLSFLTTCMDDLKSVPNTLKYKWVDQHWHD